MSWRLGHTDAIGTVSFGLECGCAIRPLGGTVEDHVYNFRGPGCTYPCPKHGRQIIVRATVKLTGWARNGVPIAGVTVDDLPNYD